MTTATAAAVNVPLLDLKAQYATIRAEIEPVVKEVIESQYFIGGPKIAELECMTAGYCRTKFAIGCANGSDAILLARLLVERNDIPNALATLQRHAMGADDNAEYRGFRAALLQRLGRHTEAIAEYRQALRLTANNAVWWVGLGMSFDATDRAKEAGDAFRQARQIGRLSADMNSYIEQRLRHLP